MSLTVELDDLLKRFLSGELPLSSYREQMMRLRIAKLDSLSDKDKSFVYAFENRYAQLRAGAIDENMFKQLLTFTARSDSAATTPQPTVWVYSEQGVNTLASATANYSRTGTHTVIPVASPTENFFFTL